MSVSECLEKIEVCERRAARHRRFGPGAIFIGSVVASLTANYLRDYNLVYAIFLASAALLLGALRRSPRSLDRDLSGLVIELARADDVRALPRLAGLFKRMPGPVTAHALAMAIERRSRLGVSPLNRRILNDLVLRSSRFPYRRYREVTSALTGASSTLIRPGDRK